MYLWVCHVDFDEVKCLSKLSELLDRKEVRIRLWCGIDGFFVLVGYSETFQLCFLLRLEYEFRMAIGLRQEILL